jgi:hypothetical protein
MNGLLGVFDAKPCVVTKSQQAKIIESPPQVAKHSANVQ